MTAEAASRELCGRRVLVVVGDRTAGPALVALLRSLGMVPTLVAAASATSAALRRADREGEPFSLLVFESSLRGSAALRARRASDDALIAATPRLELRLGPRRADEQSATDPVLHLPLTREAVLEALQRAFAGERPPPLPLGVAYDRPTLVRLMGDDEEIADRVLDHFAELAPGQLSDLDEAATTGDGPLIAAQAHRLRGGLAWICAGRAANTAAEVETLGNSGQTASAAALCPLLRQETERVLAAIRAAAGAKSA